MYSRAISGSGGEHKHCVEKQGQQIPASWSGRSNRFIDPKMTDIDNVPARTTIVEV